MKGLHYCEPSKMFSTGSPSGQRLFHSANMLSRKQFKFISSLEVRDDFGVTGVNEKDLGVWEMLLFTLEKA